MSTVGSMLTLILLSLIDTYRNHRLTPSNDTRQDATARITRASTAPIRSKMDTRHHSLNRVHRTALQPTVVQWPMSDEHNQLRTTSSIGLLDDVRRMVSIDTCPTLIEQ
jgi:hypothetical protein